MTFSRLRLGRPVVSGFSRTGVLAIVLAATALLSAQAPAGGRDASAAAVASYALTQQMPVDPEVALGTLPNGLKYYVRPNPRPARRVELRLVVKAGSVLYTVRDGSSPFAIRPSSATEFFYEGAKSTIRFE